MIYTIDEISSKLTSIFEEKGVIRAVIFGSYAKGEATEDSDIDLVVEVEDWVGGLDFFGIAGDVVDTLGKKVDFFGMDDVIPGGRADDEIKATGVMIYQKDRL